CQNREACRRGRLSCTRMPPRTSAEDSISTPSTTSANGAPAKPIRLPARLGPQTSAADMASELRAWASTKRERSTTCVNTTCEAAPAVHWMAPTAKPVKYIHVIDRHPHHHANGTLSMASAIAISPATYT